MNNLIWIGGAPAVAQAGDVVLPGDIETGQVLKATIGSKTLPYTFPGGPIREDVVAAFVALWNDSENPEFNEITASDNGDGSFSITANEPGKSFVVSFAIGSGVNEIQIVTVGSSATGGTFTLDFDGQVTAPIVFNASAATVQTTLEALSNINVGDIAVTGVTGGPWPVTFQGALADTDVALLRADYALLDGTNEEQVVTLGTATGGTFTLTYEGQATAPIAHNASAAVIQADLEALSTIGVGNVSVTGSGPWTVEFIGDLSTSDVNLIVFDGTNLTGKLAASVTETTTGGGGTNEKVYLQLSSPFATVGGCRITGNASVTSGTWSFSVTGPATITIGPLQWDATPADIQDAIEAHASIAPGGDYENMMHLRWSGGMSGNLADGSFVDVGWAPEFGAIDQYPYNVLSVNSTSLVGGTYTAGSSNDANPHDDATEFTSFYVEVDGQRTDDLSVSATLAETQSAIEGLATVGEGNVLVTGQIVANTFIRHIEWIGDFANQVTGLAINLETNSFYGTNYDDTDFIIVQGQAGTSEVQTLSITGSPGAGTFALNYDGEDTAFLVYNASAATVQAELESLTGIGTGGVVCTGGDLPGTDITITFAGGLSGLNLNEITAVAGIVAESVTAGDAPTVDVTTTQTPVSYVTTVANEGPNDWNTPSNWDLGILPGEGDILHIIDGPDIYYGLEQDSYTLAKIETRNNGTQIGLPRRDENGSLEYRQRFLKVNVDEIIIGIGEGSGTEGLYFDLDTHDTDITIYNSGSSQSSGYPVIQFIGENTANNSKLTIFDGEVGVGVLPKESAYFSQIIMYGGSLTSGDDVHFGKFTKIGGEWISDRTEVGGETTL